MPSVQPVTTAHDPLPYLYAHFEFRLVAVVLMAVRRIDVALSRAMIPVV
jgi:hypothetical protein